MVLWGLIVKISKEWFNYLLLTLISFGCFFLEYLSIGIVFMIFNGNFGVFEICIHLIVTSILWIISIALIIMFSKKYHNYPEQFNNNNPIKRKDWLITLLCLLVCKVITFIDWSSLKIVGEFQNKNLVYFVVQYSYYICEVGLMCLIIVYGQKAFETLIRKSSEIPFGGVLLALTWGAVHFFSRGIDIWNGVSCMIVSILSGIMYLRLKKNIRYSYIFIALGYLL